MSIVLQFREKICWSDRFSLIVRVHKNNIIYFDIIT
jgi:hypothetical protein